MKRPLGSPLVKKNKILVKVDVHKDIDGNTQKISVPSTIGDDPDIITIEPDSDTGNPDAFRHTQKDRKRILKGTMGSKSSTATNNAKPSESNNKYVYNFNIEAASKKSSDSSGPTYLLYIGKLAAQTTQQSLRKHLLQIGIQNKELSDILQLRCRNENERSFCVSIDGEDGKDKIYNLQNWPAGVRIRPFKRRVYGKNTSRYSQTHSTSLHSSFPNIHSASKHSRQWKHGQRKTQIPPRFRDGHRGYYHKQNNTYYQDDVKYDDNYMNYCDWDRLSDYHRQESSYDRDYMYGCDY